MLTWHEMLCEGPTVKEIDTPKFFKIRKTFLENAYDVEYDVIGITTEYNKLIQAIPKLPHKTLIKALLFSGMRYTELQRFHNNPDWFMENGFIHLPKGANLKK